MIKKIWKSGTSYVMSLSAYEIEHLGIGTSPFVDLKQARGAKLIITKPVKKTRKALTAS